MSGPVTTVRILSEEEYSILKGVIAREKAGNTRYASRPPGDGYISEHNDHQANDVYIALPRTVDGIPPLTRASSGTGTAAFNDGDTPGSAECDIFQIVEIDGTDTLVQASGELGELVYNLGDETIEQGWVLIHRDKFGKWLVSVIKLRTRMVITEETAPTTTGTGSITTGTAGNDLSPCVYRTAYPSGFTAKLLNASESPIGDNLTIYADMVRGVFFPGDKVWMERKNGRWQIDDDATLMWRGIAEQDITNGLQSKVTVIHATGNFTVYAAIPDETDSVSRGSSGLVTWDDGAQRFRIIPWACPNPIVEVSGNIGG